MRTPLKVVCCVVIAFAIILIIHPFMPSEAKPLPDISNLTLNDTEIGSGCLTVPLSLTAENTMEVPSFCIGGLCKLVLYTNAIMGAFGPGYSMEVYYAQLPSPSKSWYGGPNISLAGVAFSEGYGYNGDGEAQGVFLWGTTQDGEYIRIMDDGPFENSPELWSIESQASRSLTQASLQVCAIPGAVYSGPITSSQTIDTPEFCQDSLCMILRFSYAEFIAFGPGLTFPVFYDQDSWDHSWIGGPNINLGGMGFSSGSGRNGDGTKRTIFDGGISNGGGYAYLVDDGLEFSGDSWSVYFESGEDLDRVFYYFAPMACTKYEITERETPLDMPAYCLDSLCTMVRWTDDYFGAWGPGLSWPVSYVQRSLNNTWIGGPSLCLGGQCFSHGKGLNGDTSFDVIYDGGLTDSGTGSVILMDDSVDAFETNPLKWSVFFSPTDDLTAASFYICSNTCEETVFMINKQYLPITLR